MERPLSTDPIRTRGRFKRTDIEAEARHVAAVLRAALTGPPDSPAAWVGAAEALNCTVKTGRIVSDPASPGHYHAPSGTMIYDPRKPAAVVCRLFAHELAHHYLAHRRSGERLAGTWERWDDDRRSVQHRIAQRVEEMMVGELE
jgi:hypothetical protein